MKSLYENKNKFYESLTTFCRSAMALLVALIIGGLIIELGGFSSIDTYLAIFKGSLGKRNGILLSLSTATPLMLTGLGFTITMKSGIINTGLEGQLFLGGMASALVGAYVSFLPGITHAAVAILAGAAAGALVGLLMAVFRNRFGAPEVITGIMLNSIMQLFTGYLANGPLKPENAASPQTAPVLATAKLVKIAAKSQLTTAFIIAILIAIALHFLLKKTVWGYKMRVVGINRIAAEVAGIKSTRVYSASLALSGAIAGVAGAALSLGIYGRFVDVLSAGLGFQGIPVAALAAYSPLGVIVSSILFGILEAGANMVNQSSNIPYEFVSIVQALVVVFIAAPSILSSLFSLRKTFPKIFGSKKKSTDENAASMTR